MITYKGFIQRLDKVIDILNKIITNKKQKDYTKEDLLLIAKCYRYISRSYLKMAKINSTVSAGSGFSFESYKKGK